MLRYYTSGLSHEHITMCDH